jgi:hypothetical protein
MMGEDNPLKENFAIVYSIFSMIRAIRLCKLHEKKDSFRLTFPIMSEKFDKLF